MALPKSYLTSSKNLGDILNAIIGAQAPEKFNRRFLESLDFTSSNDRLIIGVFKMLGFIAEDGSPLDAYHEFLDQTQSGVVMARGIRSAYSDLFQVNREAQKMTKPQVQNKFKTLSKGQFSDSVLDKMAMTFSALCKHADFDAEVPEEAGDSDEGGVSENTKKGAQRKMESEQSVKWHSQRGTDPINYTTFGDLRRIMEHNWDVFEPHINDLDWAKSIFDVIERSRNVIMHSGILAPEDTERIGVNIRDWVRQVGS